MMRTPLGRPFIRASRQWRGADGTCWEATLLQPFAGNEHEREIQVEGSDGPPHRVLCVGSREPHLESLRIAELELVRRAAAARRGFLWLDPRDGALWWVHGTGPAAIPSPPTYSGPRWSGIARSEPPLPLTLLPDDQHQKLLDEARASSRRRGMSDAPGPHGRI